MSLEIRITKRDHSHSALALANRIQPQTQLHHVLAAGQSPEVAEEEEMDGATPVHETGEAQ